MNRNLELSDDAMSNEHHTDPDDAVLSQEISRLSGPLKAKLVIDYLGLSTGVGGKQFPDVSKVTVPPKKAHDYRLIQGLLKELTREFSVQASRVPTLENSAPPPENDFPDKELNGDAPTRPHLNMTARKQTPLALFSSCENADLSGQHPRIAALLLSTLDTKGAAKALRKLDSRTSRRLALGLSWIEAASTPVPAPVMDIILLNAN